MKVLIGHIGNEKSIDLANNSSATDLVGVSIDKADASCVFFDYLIQRIHSASENVEAGTFIVSYLPDSDDYQISNGPSSAGVTITVTSSGQVQYATSNISGDISLSRITVRPRKIFAKSSQYSKLEKGGVL